MISKYFLTIVILLMICFSSLIVVGQKNEKVIKFAVLETGFCVEKFEKKTSIKIHENFDATKSLRENPCELNEDHPRLHGQKVLEVFLKNYEGKTNLEIFPITIFDRFGRQKISYWENAYKKAESLKVDVILTASGFPHHKKLDKYPKWEILTFAPTGKIEGSIKSNTLLFPQVLAPNENLLIIGNYVPTEDRDIFSIDKKLLYKNVADFLFPEKAENEKLKGTSFSVAFGAAKAMSFCSVENMRNCLNCRVKILKTVEKDVLIKTF